MKKFKRKRKGSELEFISWINRDGSGTVPITAGMLEAVQGETFRVYGLSLTQATYIAIGFNSFVVRLKNKT